MKTVSGITHYKLEVSVRSCERRSELTDTPRSYENRHLYLFWYKAIKFCSKF